MPDLHRHIGRVVLGIVNSYLDHFSSAPTLGGTGVRAALALAQAGIPNTVHLVSDNRVFRELLPPQVQIITTATKDTWEPHLIIQYPAGAKVDLEDGSIRSKSPNRIILVNDRPNELLEPSPQLPELFRKANVVLVSGFNAMLDPTLTLNRTRQVTEALSECNPRPIVFLEDAGYHLHSVLEAFHSGFKDVADIHSMNEDELQNYIDREIDLLDPHSVRQAIEDVMPHVLAPTLVLHTRHFALAHGQRAQILRPSLAAGNDLAGARYMFGDSITESALTNVQAAPHQSEAVEFARAFNAIEPDAVVVPARALEPRTPTTIGLGDTFVAGVLGDLVTRNTHT
uniref:ADP-dependent glucokinase/phosphofructokinase n=1 Tax=Tessaracoccus timonensis TaxID=2161816 RepID=UPI00131ED224|nr:ADP-dependent glucokinase/phosphofructokinase [Tessaracoccus timonensis]